MYQFRKERKDMNYREGQYKIYQQASRKNLLQGDTRLSTRWQIRLKAYLSNLLIFLAYFLTYGNAVSALQQWLRLCGSRWIATTIPRQPGLLSRSWLRARASPLR